MVALRRSGFAAVQIDRIGRFGFDPEADRQRPALSGEGSSLAGSTLFGHERNLADDDTRVLLAAMPEASGMAGPADSEGYNVLVTVVTTEQRVKEAMALLQRYGARV